MIGHEAPDATAFALSALCHGMNVQSIEVILKNHGIIHEELSTWEGLAIAFFINFIGLLLVKFRLKNYEPSLLDEIVAGTYVLLTVVGIILF